MSNVRQFKPANRLAEAIARAPTLTADRCLRQAERNLKQIEPACVADVDRSLDLLEKALQVWPSAIDTT